MIEVFKTNVQDREQANRLVAMIHQAFGDYTANFDLHDCDKILRVKSVTGTVHAQVLVQLLQEAGCYAEVLPDECPPVASKAPKAVWMPCQHLFRRPVH